MSYAPGTGYAITQDKAELDRLVNYAHSWDGEVRRALSCIGVGQGWKAIDVGCGPVGSLLTLAELVGPDGLTVGLDVHEPSLRRARAILDEHGARGARLVCGDINELTVETVCPPGPFDVPFCRNVLTHQKDAAETLRRIAALVRPGGYVVAHNQMGDPLPAPLPALPALDRYTDWVVPQFQQRGSRWVARQHHELCLAAGLKEVSQRGFFRAGADTTEIRARKESLISWRSAIVASGVASGEDVDAAIRQLQEAEGCQFEAVFSGLYVELIAQVR
jgi:ubiquinone/menaquinone biosynthesis C-methylase UbiE